MKIQKYNIIYKFLSIHFIKSFGVVFLCLAGIVCLFSILNNTKTFAGKSLNIPFSVVIQFAINDLLYVINTIMPLSILLSGTLTFWKLSRSSELVIIRSVGLSVWQFLMPVLSVCIFIGIFNMMVLSPIKSSLQKHISKLSYKYEINSINPLSFSQKGLWLKEKTDIIQSFINMGYIKKQDSNLYGKNITIFMTDLNNIFLKRIEASSAILQDKVLMLNNVKIITSKLVIDTFDKYEYPTKLTINKIEESSSIPETFSFWELPGFITFFENAGFSARKHRAYFYTLLFMPLTLCSMLFISSIFSISPKRNQSKLAIKLSCGVLFGFCSFFIEQIIKAMGTSGKIPLFLSSISIQIISILICITVLLYHEDG